MAIKIISLLQDNSNELCVKEIQVMRNNKNNNVVNYVDRRVVLLLCCEGSLTSFKAEVQSLLWLLAEGGAVHSCFWADLQHLGRRLHWDSVYLSRHLV